MEELEKMMDDIMGIAFELEFYYDLIFYIGAMYIVVRDKDNIGATREEIIQATECLVQFAEELYNSGATTQELGEGLIEAFIERGVEYTIDSCKNKNYHVIEKLFSIVKDQNLKDDCYILIDYFRKYFIDYIRYNEPDLYLEFML